MTELLRSNWELATSSIFLAAVLTGLAMAFAGGAVGVVVLLRREAMLVVALPQVVLVGAAGGLRWLGPSAGEPSGTEAWITGLLGTAERSDWFREHTGWPTLPGAIAAILLALAFLASSRSRQGERSGSTRAAAVALPSLFAAALCLSVLIVFSQAEHWTDMQKRYVGVEVAVDDHLAEITVPILVGLALWASFAWRRWLLIAQAPASAQLAGLRPARWDAMFIALLSTLILLGTNALGPVCVTAMLLLPAATVLPWARRVPSAILASVFVSIVSYAAGFVVSNEMNWPLAQSVGGVGSALFVPSYLASRLRG